jgi:hypothetical protein
MSTSDCANRSIGNPAKPSKARKVAKAATRKRTVAKAKPKKRATVKKAARRLKQPVAPAVETVAVEEIEETRDESLGPSDFNT